MLDKIIIVCYTLSTKERKELIKMKTKFNNVRIKTYSIYETLEERDMRICEEVKEEYQPSELTNDIQKLLKDNKIETDFNSLIQLAKIIEDYDCSLIIESDGTLLIYDCYY